MIPTLEKRTHLRQLLIDSFTDKMLDDFLNNLNACSRSPKPEKLPESATVFNEEAGFFYSRLEASFDGKKRFQTPI